MRTIIRFGLLAAACALILGTVPRLLAQDDDIDPRQKMLDDFRRAQEKQQADLEDGHKQQAEEWGKLSAKMEAQYQGLMKKLEAQREQLKKRVAKQWTEFHESTNKEWVDYSSGSDSMSKVDFEKGEIEIETLIPLEDVTKDKGKKAATFSELDAKEQAKLRALAEEKIKEQTKKVVTVKEEPKPADVPKPVDIPKPIDVPKPPKVEPVVKAEPKVEVLKDQIKTPDGSAVTEKNVDSFVKETVAPKMVVEEKPVVAQDGKPRLKVKVKIGMSPDHMRIRAKQHEKKVQEYAKKYDMAPELIYAIIHTESCFNPLAKSQAPAFGLMQLMPKYGAREAYQYIYKKEKIVDPEYLYEPDQNIELGATYMHMLMTRHYKKIKDPDSRRAISIAAYNCGPGRVNKDILSRGDLNSMSNAQVLGLIKKYAPVETQYYVPRVQERMDIYRNL